MPEATRTLYYDAACGLCTGAVRLLRRADRRAGSLLFEPLGGARFVAEVPEEVRRTLPDSLVLATGGRTLVRSEAVLEALSGIGGAWRIAARAGRLFPRSGRDRLYDWIAANRGAARCRVNR